MLNLKMKMKRVATSLCAIVCAASLLAPAAQSNAFAIDSKKTSSFTDAVPSLAEGILSKKNTDNTSASEIPVYSTFNGSFDNVLFQKADILAGQTLTYNVTLSKDASLLAHAIAEVDSGYVSFTLTDANGKTISSTSSSNALETFHADYVPAGNYTVTITSQNSIGTATFQLIGVDASKEATIKAGSTLYIGYNKSGSDVYRKITVSKDQCIAFQVSSDDLNSGTQIALCNSKKKALSTSKYTSKTNKFAVYYALKKGTYYIKISSQGNFLLQATNVASGTIAPTSKKKAKKLTSSYKNYIIPASTSKSSGWFKVNVKKPKKQTLTISYLGDYSVTATVYKGNKKEGSYTLYSGDRHSFYYKTYSGKKTTWSKGTYYIKISKNQKTDSGLVKLKVK